MQKVLWGDGHWSRVSGGDAAVEVTESSVYLVLPLRNARARIAVLHGWCPSTSTGRDVEDRPAPSDFRVQNRDLYVAPNDVGFWRGGVHDRTDAAFPGLEKAITHRERFRIDLLYGDHEGGQRTISRFAVVPREIDTGGSVRSCVTGTSTARPKGCSGREAAAMVSPPHPHS